jgi:hypothetical protein
MQNSQYEAFGYGACRAASIQSTHGTAQGCSNESLVAARLSGAIQELPPAQSKPLQI